MNEDANKHLYRWKKSTSKHDSKLGAKVNESNNIQSIHQWLRKVEDASDKAITNAFNTSPSTSGASGSKKAAVSCNTDPYSEAHDLINGWVTDKVRLDMDEDFYNYVGVDEMNRFTTTENYLAMLKAEIMRDDEDSQDLLDIKGFDYDKYDENYIARDIVNKMMKKKIVDPKKLNEDDSNKAKKGDNLQMKIEMRHQAVKMNREKKNQEIEAKRKLALEKKEVELKARQMVEKEESDRRARAEIEQQLIEQEVQRLRLEADEKRRHDEEVRRRQKEVDAVRLERERQEIANIRKQLELEQLESDMLAKRNEIAERRAEDLADSYLRAKKTRIVQRAFSSWYGEILETHLKIGKATAFADWKLSYRVFNAWKRVGNVEKIQREQETYQKQIQYENIKSVHASNFYRARLLKKCFDYWVRFGRESVAKKKLDEEKAMRKRRMEKFLEAATQSKISNEEVDEVEATKENKKPIRMKKIVHRKVKEVLDRSESEMDTDMVVMDLEKKVKDLMLPFVGLKSGTGGFDSRFKAQEKMLREQHEMIKNQQKVIEEMKFEQNQVAFKEQIKLLEEIKAKQMDLEKMQKIQYQQEKKLLKQQADLVKQKYRKIRPVDNEGDDNVEDISSLEEVQEVGLNSPRSKMIVSVRKENGSQMSARSQTTSLNATSQRSQVATGAFARGMEERARQREEMKRDREEKKRKAEFERLELARLQQQEKLKVEEEERAKKMEEVREKRRLQKEIDEKKNLEKVKEEKLNALADQFYKNHLVRYYGMNGFKKLVRQRQDKMRLAEFKYSGRVLGRILTCWRDHTRLVVDLKEDIAEDFNNRRILKNYFNALKNSKKAAQIACAKATRFYKYQIKKKLYDAIKAYTEAELARKDSVEIMIKEHNEKRVVSRYFKVWRDFPGEMKRDREKQKRLEDLRRKVKEMIPDYGSPEESLG